MAQAQVTGRTTPAQPEMRRVTLNEYLELLDTEGYEVIDGELIAMTPQHINSTRVAHRLLFSIERAIREKSLGEVYTEAVFSLEIEQDTQWVTGSLVPDVAFITMERVKQQEDRYPGAGAMRVVPNIAVEVVSPTDKFSDVAGKVARYLGYGVELVWVVDPQNRRVHVYTPDEPDGRTLSETGTLSAEAVLPGWSMSLKELFGVETD